VNAYETKRQAGTGTARRLALLALAVASPLPAQHAIARRITIDSSQRLARFDPSHTFGAAIDGRDAGDLARVFTPVNLAAMNSAGFGPLTLRLRTELAIEAWHWNEAGEWSDSAHRQGYWTSSDRMRDGVTTSYGYRLPRRGRTIDDAGNDGFSRLDDGDTLSFWKSNPYLDAHYTHDADTAHRQWLVADLGRALPVNQMVLAWGAPYPRRYRVEYWIGDESLPIHYNPEGQWQAFAGGVQPEASGGVVTLALSSTPVTTRFVRIVMEQSSHTAPVGSRDPRDSVGFALREVWLGTRDAQGAFHDLIHHDTLAAQQTAMLVSSTDPWHRAADRDTTTAEPTFSRLLASGLTHRQPVLVPTGLLFDTPANAAAELRYLRSRQLPLAGIELGEEADGQFVTPEDYAALYLQFAAALHDVDPTARLGGPSWQTLDDDPLRLWPGDLTASPPTWIGRFLEYIAQRGRQSDFRFLSFEWYPFDNVCDNPAGDLASAHGDFSLALQRLHLAGVPDSLPRIMAEYGFSAYPSRAEITLPGAIFDADLLGNFVSHGGSQAFFFGYEPGELYHLPSCPRSGTLGMLLDHASVGTPERLPRYWSARLVTRDWVDSTGGAHELFAIHSDISDDSLLTSYALHRPDRRWSILLVNRDPIRARSVSIAVGQARPRALHGPVDIWQYSGEQYQWPDDTAAARPVRNLPPSHRRRRAVDRVELPAYSITVVVGQ
jgi:hypothetical protein